MAWRTVLLVVAALAAPTAGVRLQHGTLSKKADCPVPPGFEIVPIKNSTLGKMSMAVRIEWRKDLISRFLRNRGYWEIRHPRELGELAGAEVPATGTFLDIGANLGWYTLLFAKAGYKVIAVEPMDVNRRAIETTLCLNPDIRKRVTLVNAALVAPEDRNNKCVLYATSTNRGNGILTCAATDAGLPCNTSAPANEGEGGTCEEVPVRTLDALLKDQRVKSLDVVKMDVEGFECNVLRGGQTLFNKFHVKLVQAETKVRRVRACFEEEAGKHGYRMGSGVGSDQNRVISSLFQDDDDEASERAFVTLTRPDVRAQDLGRIS